MRKVKNYVKEIQTSFLSCEKDLEILVNKLFVSSEPYSSELKRLLLINTKDCLDDRVNETYKNLINNTQVSDLIEQQYLIYAPFFEMGENEGEKSFIRISFNNFQPALSNTYFRVHSIDIDVLCPHKYWDLGNYRLRPFKIAGIIDGILNNTKLTGIGLVKFLGAEAVTVGDHYSGYCLKYAVYNADDDLIENEDYE